MTDLSHIRYRGLADKVMSAEEAAALIEPGSNVGMSGFTGAGYPKAVPTALARRITEATARGERRPIVGRREPSVAQAGPNEIAEPLIARDLVSNRHAALTTHRTGRRQKTWPTCCSAAQASKHSQHYRPLRKMSSRILKPPRTHPNILT